MRHKVGEREAKHPSKKTLLSASWAQAPGTQQNSVYPMMFPAHKGVGIALQDKALTCGPFPGWSLQCGYWVRVQGGGQSPCPPWSCPSPVLMSPVLGLPEPLPWISPAPQGNSRAAGLG